MFLIYPDEDKIVKLEANPEKLFLYLQKKNDLPEPPDHATSDEIVEFLKKQVPAGVPYLKVRASDEALTDREFRDAWEADFSNPDGFGEAE